MFGEGEGDALSTPRSFEITALEQLISTADGAALNLAFVKIADLKVKRSVIALVKALASREDGDTDQAAVDHADDLQ